MTFRFTLDAFKAALENFIKNEQEIGDEEKNERIIMNDWQLIHETNGSVYASTNIRSDHGTVWSRVDIVYSPVYQVPQLFFLPARLTDSSILTTDQVRDLYFALNDCDFAFGLEVREEINKGRYTICIFTFDI